MASNKKILFIVEAMGGGVFTYIVELANELAGIYDIYIAYAVRPQTPENYKDYFDGRIHLIEVKNFCRSINPLKDVKALLEIKKIAANVQPDIIHLHSSKAGVLGRVAFDGRRIPLFYTPHGYSFLMESYGSGKRKAFKIIETVCARRDCTTISCSLGEHYESLKLTRYAAYVSNGINVDELQRLIDSADNKVSSGRNCQDSFTVFTLGRICGQKNPRLFNEIAKLMPDVSFQWIGDGELRHELTASNIKIIGWCDRRVALQHSLKCDVFLLTSLWEGLPISLLEAMYMRKVCVVSDVIGNRDVIKNGRNGFICRDVNEFVAAIRKAQAKEIDNIIENAYSDILDTYNTKIMAEEYSAIYEKLLGDVPMQTKMEKPPGGYCVR